jgi:hypothetical protein
MSSVTITAVRSEALFVSSLQRSVEPSPGQVEDAIRQAMRRWGSRGCAALVAQEFGDHPDTAVPRMRWARGVVEQAFTSPHRPAAPRRTSVSLSATATVSSHAA